MNYYITGAGGFIGKNIVKYINNLGGTIVKKIQDVNGPYTVIHLAAYGNHFFQKDVTEMIKANITDLDTLTHFCYKYTHFNLLKFYNISSSSVTLPVQTPYSASKLMGETIINSLNDPRFVNVRPYSVYGPGEAAHRFIPTVIRCLKSGEKMQLDPLAVHDWIYIDDFIKAMFDGHTEIGTGYKHSNIEVVKMLEDISGKRLNYEEVTGLRPYDNHSWVCKKGIEHRYIYEGLKLCYESA